MTKLYGRDQVLKSFLNFVQETQSFLAGILLNFPICFGPFADVFD
jgi:hypothetical protein